MPGGGVVLALSLLTPTEAATEGLVSAPLPALKGHSLSLVARSSTLVSHGWCPVTASAVATGKSLPPSRARSPYLKSREDKHEHVKCHSNEGQGLSARCQLTVLCFIPGEII